MQDFRTLALNAAQGSTWLAEDTRADGARVVDIQQFTYNASFLAIAAGADATRHIQINNDSDFICDALAASCFFSAAGGQRSTLLGTVQITDLATQRTFFAQPAHLAANFGSLGIPMILPVPKTFVADSKLIITLTNTATAERDFHINLMGSRIFYA